MNFELENKLFAACNRGEPIYVTDSKWGKRKVIPQSISNDLISGKALSCFVITVEKLGDCGNRQDSIKLKDIIDVKII